MQPLTLAGVGVRHRGGPEVLRDVDLRLDGGAPVVVTGANGSGKSSLLRVVAGCARPTSGTVTGRPRTVGYVPDRFPSQLRMPAAGYLRHMAALHHADPGPAQRSAAELLGALGFTGGLTVAMARLSKGNAQKVALAQALCSGAPLLVLDEPWSGLDVGAAAAVTDRVAAAAAGGAAVLVTDHTGTAAGLPGCRVLHLDGGRLRPAGPPVTGPTVTIVLGTSDPRRTAARLGLGREHAVGPDRLTVRVPVDRRDALLAQALSLGCGVLAVQP